MTSKSGGITGVGPGFSRLWLRVVSGNGIHRSSPGLLAVSIRPLRIAG